MYKSWEIWLKAQISPIHGITTPIASDNAQVSAAGAVVVPNGFVAVEVPFVGNFYTQYCPCRFRENLEAQSEIIFIKWSGGEVHLLEIIVCHLEYLMCSVKRCRSGQNRWLLFFAYCNSLWRESIKWIASLDVAL